jgi:hypothetical protein
LLDGVNEEKASRQKARLDAAKAAKKPKEPKEPAQAVAPTDAKGLTQLNPRRKTKADK